MGRRKSLYDELIRIEGANKELARARESFAKSLNEYEGLAGYVPIIDEITVPVIEVATAQREAIDSYRDNQYVRKALDREQTLEQATHEIQQINRGIRRILPRRKNDEQNQRVDELDNVLSSGSIDLVSKGIFYIDNPLPTALAAAAIFTGGISLIQGLLYGEILQLDDLAYMAGAGIVLGGAWGCLPRIIGGLENNAGRLNRARYIDQKINELYKGE